MVKNKRPECPKCLPGWLVQFGDLMSLLLTFFILLLSMATMNDKRVEEYFELFKKSLGIIDDTQNDIREQTEALSSKQSEDSSDELDGTAYEDTGVAEQVEEILQEFNDTSNQEYPEIMKITKGQNEFSLDIPVSLLFVKNQYNITNKNTKKFIAKISRIIRTMPESFAIEVSGHTSKNGYKQSSLPRDNWDISALRAISVVQEFIKNKIDPSLLKVSAFSSYRPKSNISKENKRVEIKFIANKGDDSILNKDNFFDKLELN